ncbi:MAG: hypothetical protein Q4D20_01065, partial [Clostridia bacterium]|nr:hypothetical protein [Clostridia bacterium]
TAMVVPLRAFQTQSRRKYNVKDLVNSAFHCFVLGRQPKVPPGGAVGCKFKKKTVRLKGQYQKNTPQRRKALTERCQRKVFQ